MPSAVKAFRVWPVAAAWFWLPRRLYLQAEARVAEWKKRIRAKAQTSLQMMAAGKARPTLTIILKLGTSLSLPLLAPAALASTLQQFTSTVMQS